MEADADESGDYSKEELEALTVKQILALAKEKGYPIKTATKAGIIDEFLNAQN